MTVTINLKIFLFAILFYFTRQIEIYAMLMIFALLHEMGHLICGLILGLQPKSLKIMPMGVCVEFKVICEDYNTKIKNANLLAIKQMLIALAGPITNLIIVAICMLLKQYINVAIYNQIIYSNILIAIFNLIPIYPLDGARILKDIIHITKGKQKSVKYINVVSNTTIIIITMLASIAIYYYQNIAILLIVLYLWGMTIIENRKYGIKKRIYKIMSKV